MVPSNATGPIVEFAGKLGTFVINPILFLIFGAGLVVFVWGLVQYLYAVNVSGEHADDGKRHMFWGMVGMFIMAAAVAIIRILANTIGAQLPFGY
jgi:hypothetical protein